MKNQQTFTEAQQFDNICALRDYLETEVNPANFYMGFYRSDNNQRRNLYFNKNDCGTCGCALGWAPFVRGLETIKSDFITIKESNTKLDFECYCKRVFGIKLRDSAWRNLFSNLGNKDNNNLQGVIKRFDNYILTTKGK